MEQSAVVRDLELAEAARRAAWQHVAGVVGEELADRKGELARVCFHESAHAVLALIHHRYPLQIVVKVNGRSYVQMSEEPETGKTQSDDERLSCIDKVLLGAGELPLDLEQVRSDVRELLLAHSTAVKAIAAALLGRLIGADRAVLTGREAKLLFQFNTNTEVTCSKETN